MLKVCFTKEQCFCVAEKIFFLILSASLRYARAKEGGKKAINEEGKKKKRR